MGSSKSNSGGGGQAGAQVITAPAQHTANQPALEAIAGQRILAAAPWASQALRPVDYFQGMQTPQNYFPQFQPGQMAGAWGPMQAPGFGAYGQQPGFGQGGGWTQPPWPPGAG